MLRRAFIKLLSIAPGLSLFNKPDEYEWDHKETNWTFEDNKYYKYYFGALGSGKTTRLISDAITWLDANKADGLFVVNHFYQIKSIYRNILLKYGKDSWLSRATFVHSKNILYIPSGSSLRFISQDNKNQILSMHYSGLWTDEITKENRTFIEAGVRIRPDRIHSRVQHVISMIGAHDLYDKLRIEPVVISRNVHIPSLEQPNGAVLWGIQIGE